MKTKLCRPILVPTKEKSIFDGQLCLNGNHLFIARECDDVGDLQPQKLILISLDPEEKIEVDKLHLDVWNNEIIIMDLATKNMLDCGMLHNPYCKIIATQDQISKEYIQQFVEQYDSGKVEDVEIEMNSVLITESSTKYENNDIIVNGILADSIHYELEEELQKTIKRYNVPKLNDDNQVQIIKKKPILYTEKEVIQMFKSWLLCKVEEELQRLSGEIGLMDGITFDDWFKQNKKK